MILRGSLWCQSPGRGANWGISTLAPFYHAPSGPLAKSTGTGETGVQRPLCPPSPEMPGGLSLSPTARACSQAQVGPDPGLSPQTRAQAGPSPSPPPRSGPSP